MSLESRKKKVKRLINKLFKANIPLENVTDKDEEQLSRPKALERFEKLVKRALERESIVKESAEITERMKERVKAEREKKQIKQNIKNDKFLKAHPQFKQVFKYDTKHNKSGDAQLTAKSYMEARKRRLFNELCEQFDISDKFKEKLHRQIFTNDYSIDLIEGMETIGQHLIYKRDSDGDDVEMDLGVYDSPDDEYINRLLNRYHRLRLGQVNKSR